MPIKIIVIRATASVCKVVPPVNVAHRDDEVQWSNRTGGKITVFVRAGIFDEGPLALQIDNNQTGNANVEDEAPYGLFPYSIFCEATNNNAIGNSEPEIIIDA
jgi:hypothetical protein